MDDTLNIVWWVVYNNGEMISGADIIYCGLKAAIEVTKCNREVEFGTDAIINVYGRKFTADEIYTTHNYLLNRHSNFT